MDAVKSVSTHQARSHATVEKDTCSRLTSEIVMVKHQIPMFSLISSLSKLPCVMKILEDRCAIELKFTRTNPICLSITPYYNKVRI